MKDEAKYSFHVCGAEEWEINEIYDCFWLQWTLMFLKDDDAIVFLRNCGKHLSSNGFIVVKDNIASPDLDAPDDHAIWFPDDRSITRTHNQYLSIFKMAHLSVVKFYDENIHKLPQFNDIFPIFIYILK